MNKKTFSQTLIKWCEELGIEFKQDRAADLYVYFTELQRWSKKINLIGKSSDALQILETHFLDSLTLLLLLDRNSRLLDIGTGAGLPGLVCKAAKPELSVSLVEPRLKRVTFLNHIVRMLELYGVQVFPKRIEDFAVPEEGFTHITSRAVNDIEKFCTMVLPFAEADVHVVCMKGPRWEEELEKAKKADLFEIKNYTVTSKVLPSSGAERFLVDIELSDGNK